MGYSEWLGVENLEEKKMVGNGKKTFMTLKWSLSRQFIRGHYIILDIEI